MIETFVPVILGPTASGKTSVGMELARLIDAEVISVDSRKIYEGLPIGTATPQGTWENGVFVVEGIPHHLMGYLSPDRPYTAGDFAEDAERLLLEIRRRGKTPLLVGGTGFYFNALMKGLPPVPVRDEKIRSGLMARLEKEGVEALFEELKTRDPESAALISSKDKHKIIRALEVTQISGRPFSAWKTEPRRASPHKFRVMGLTFPKEILDRRIEARSRMMVERGMIRETEAVLKKGFPPSCPALVSFGYKEAVEVIQGRLTEPEFLSLLIKKTKAYAKRQTTWFRTQISPRWFPCDETSRKEEIAVEMKAFLDSPKLYT